VPGALGARRSSCCSASVGWRLAVEVDLTGAEGLKSTASVRTTPIIRIPQNPHKSKVYEPGKGLDFHFDKDEHLLVEEGVMSNPTWSSVLYLSGSAGAKAQREGALLRVVCLASVWGIGPGRVMHTAQAT